MKKFISACVFLIGLAFAMPAQSQIIRFGVKAGTNLTKAEFSQSDLSGKNSTGFFVGPMAEVKIPFLGFGADGAILYSMNGVKSSTAQAKTMNVSSIEIPLNLKYTLGSSKLGIFVAAGPQFGFNINKTGNDDIRDYSFKTATVSINAGIGLKLLGNIEVAANKNFPCTTNADYANTSTGVTKDLWNYKSKGWQISLAYLF